MVEIGIRKPSDLPDPVPVVISVGLRLSVRGRTGDATQRADGRRAEIRRAPRHAEVRSVRGVDERQPDSQVRPAEDAIVFVEQELAQRPYASSSESANVVARYSTMLSGARRRPGTGSRRISLEPSLRMLGRPPHRCFSIGRTGTAARTDRGQRRCRRPSMPERGPTSSSSSATLDRWGSFSSSSHSACYEAVRVVIRADLMTHSHQRPSATRTSVAPRTGNGTSESAGPRKTEKERHDRIDLDAAQAIGRTLRGAESHPIQVEVIAPKSTTVPDPADEAISHSHEKSKRLSTESETVRKTIQSEGPQDQSPARERIPFGKGKCVSNVLLHVARPVALTR